MCKKWYLVKLEAIDALAYNAISVDEIICKAARVEVNEAIAVAKAGLKPEGELEQGMDLTAEMPAGR